MIRHSDFVIRHSNALLTLTLILILPVFASAQTQPATQPANTVVAPGTVAAFYTADLYAKESGYVSEVLADIGDHVEKRQPLAVIDNPELKQQLVAAQATETARREMVKAADAMVQQAKAAVEVAKRQLAGIEADLKLTQVTLKRQEELFAGKAITVQQLDEMRVKAEIAAARK